MVNGYAILFASLHADLLMLPGVIATGPGALLGEVVAGDSRHGNHGLDDFENDPDGHGERPGEAEAWFIR